MINISNFTSEDKSPRWQARPVRADPRPVRPGAVRPGQARLTAAAVLVSWLAAIPRRLGMRLFAINDNEAYWRGWEITRVHGGLGRRYRDARFGTLAACARCQGAGVTAKVPCVPCLGTGRLTLDEVS